MASIYKKSDKWYIQYYLDGKKISKSSGLDSTKENKKYLEKEVIPKLEAKLMLGFIKDIKNIKFEYFATKYLDYKNHLKTFNEIESRVNNYILPKFKMYDITQIKSSLLKDFLFSLLDSKTPKTVRSYLIDLRGIFLIALEDGIIDKNPLEYIKLPEHIKDEVEPFTKSEVELILNNSKGWFQNFLAISLYTGMRPGEIIALKLKDIKNESILINKSIRNSKITTPKTKKSIREIPILKQLKFYLNNQIELAKQSNSEFLFFKDDLTHFNSSDEIRGNVKNGRWFQLLKACKIEYRKMYNTRHTFITTSLNSGEFSIMQIAKIVGHSSPQMILQNYAKFIKGEHLKINKNFDLY